MWDVGCEMSSTWQEAIEAGARHIKMGTRLQKDGLDGIRQILAGQAGYMSMSQCHQSIALGVRLERDGYKNLLYLERARPHD